MIRLSRVSPTISRQEAARRDWQVVVVGAGPAGSLAARELARRGARVLLVDKSSFPRSKVCGGCLGHAALQVLRDCDLPNLLSSIDAQPTTALRLYGDGVSASLRFPAGAAVSREAFDAALVAEAIAAGAEFLDATTCKLDRRQGDLRSLRLLADGLCETATTRLVLAADGLAGVLLTDHQDFSSQIANDSRIGIGAIVPGDTKLLSPGEIAMVYQRGGYLGLVQVEEGRLAAAAAFDIDYIRTVGGPVSAAINHLRRVGLDSPKGFAEARWIGTPALSRRRKRLWDHRLMVIGDAAGYIEPMTGEGMTWALVSARAVVPWALQAIEQWKPELGAQWQRSHRHLIQRRQLVCRAVTALLRYPSASRQVIRLLAKCPWLVRPAVRQVSRSFRFGSEDTRPNTFLVGKESG